MNDRSERRGLAAILRAAMSGALDWRLLALFAGTALWTSMIATFPAWRVMASVFDDSPRAQEIAGAFDLLAMQDMGMALARSAAPVTGGIGLATLFALLSWPFLAAMAIGAARRDRPRTFAEVLEGGIAYYVRMLRIGLVAIVPLALVGGVSAGVFRGARQFGRRAVFESQATLGWRVATLVVLAIFVLIHATIEAGRAAYGVDDDLRSGWSAWLRGVKLIGREPRRAIGAYLGATLASYAIAVPLLVLRLRISGPSGVALVAGFILTQLAVASLGWGRASRLFALTAIARSHAAAAVAPSASEDDARHGGYTVPSGSMFRELEPRKPVARRG